MKYSHETYVLQTGLKKLGFDPGPLDGLRGSKTMLAFGRSLEARHGKVNVKTDLPPRPKGTTAAKTKIFGRAGSPPRKTFVPPYPMEFSWGGKVKKIGCHSMILEPLKSALTEIAGLGEEYIRKHGLHLYAGCFNDRSVRGGFSKSDHAWAIAVDINPDANGNHTTWRPGAKGSNGTYQMPRQVVKIFQKYGFQVGFKRSDGTRRDMMHVAFVDRD